MIPVSHQQKRSYNDLRKHCQDPATRIRKHEGHPNRKQQCYVNHHSIAIETPQQADADA
jgi:hypothetical protein